MIETNFTVRPFFYYVLPISDSSVAGTAPSDHSDASKRLKWLNFFNRNSSAKNVIILTHSHSHNVCS